MKTIIHDFNKETSSAFELPDENVVVLNADGHYAPCRGCFACWLKNTGFCVMDDSLKHAGALIGQSDPLIIISRLCYGGYSPGVKAVLDRAIGVSLPFFTWRGGQTHHMGRYPQRKLLRILFYGDCTESERQTAQSLPSATGSTLDTKQRKRCFSKILHRSGERYHEAADPQCKPQKRGGASQFFSGILRLFLPGLVKKTVPLRSRKDFDHALSQLGSADAVCISFPLYVDGLPSHLAEFLSLAEEYCTARSLRFRLYAIANNGFIEGQQNRTALRILESWCLHSGAIWSGGIGIGGGVMLRVLGIVYPVLIALSIVQIAVSFLTAGSVPPDMLYTLAIQAGSWLFFNFGVLFCLARLSAAVRKRKTVKSRYTRVLLPSFLFVPIADLFMILSSLSCGRFLFALLKQDDCSRHKG